jgi:hypothetical protein
VCFQCASRTSFGSSVDVKSARRSTGLGLVALRAFTAVTGLRGAPPSATGLPASAVLGACTRLSTGRLGCSGAPSVGVAGEAVCFDAADTSSAANRQPAAMIRARRGHLIV